MTVKSDETSVSPVSRLRYDDLPPYEKLLLKAEGFELLRGGWDSASKGIRAASTAYNFTVSKLLEVHRCSTDEAYKFAVENLLVALVPERYLQERGWKPVYLRDTPKSFA